MNFSNYVNLNGDSPKTVLAAKDAPRVSINIPMLELNKIAQGVKLCKNYTNALRAILANHRPCPINFKDGKFRERTEDFRIRGSCAFAGCKQFFVIQHIGQITNQVRGNDRIARGIKLDNMFPRELRAEVVLGMNPTLAALGNLQGLKSEGVDRRIRHEVKERKRDDSDDLIDLDLVKLEVVFMDPYGGEREIRGAPRILRNWKKFLDLNSSRMASKHFELKRLSHPLQSPLDSVNCGIFVAAFAQAIFMKKTSCENFDIIQKREEYLLHLLQISIDIGTFCGFCNTVDQRNCITCTSCGKIFHVHCLDDRKMSMDTLCFICFEYSAGDPMVQASAITIHIFFHISIMLLFSVGFKVSSSSSSSSSCLIFVLAR